MNTKSALLLSLLTSVIALSGCGDKTVVYEKEVHGDHANIREVKVHENGDGTVTKTETKTETVPERRTYDTERRKDDVIVKLPGVEIKKN